MKFYVSTNSVDIAWEKCQRTKTSCTIETLCSMEKRHPLFQRDTLFLPKMENNLHLRRTKFRFPFRYFSINIKMRLADACQKFGEIGRGLSLWRRISSQQHQVFDCCMRPVVPVAIHNNCDILRLQRDGNNNGKQIFRTEIANFIQFANP